MSEDQRTEKLIKLCLRGKRQAQFQFYELHKVFLYGICMRYASSKSDAEDMLQDAFSKIFRDLHQYSGQVPVTAWMRKVTVNTALMHIRKYKKVRFEELIADDIPQEIKYYDNLNLDDRAHSIIQLIRGLSATQQAVFNLKAMDGYSFVEISKILDCKESTLRSHYMRARKALQEMLKKELN